MKISFRAWIEIVVLAVLAATIVVLVLNHLETDEYPPDLDPSSSSASPPTWVPRLLLHPCVWCELCPHRFEAGETRLAVTVRDRDGWYRLFWAGAETYTYEDPAFIGGALRNRTAELTGGTWTIRGRYAPITITDPHPCPAAPDEIELRYRLHRGKFPGESEPLFDPSRALAVPRRWLWFRFPFPPDRIDDFWWELDNPDMFAGVNASRCACDK